MCSACSGSASRNDTLYSVRSRSSPLVSDQVKERTVTRAELLLDPSLALAQIERCVQEATKRSQKVRGHSKRVRRAWESDMAGGHREVYQRG